MYSALTYFGSGTLVCTSTSSLDNGKTVSVAGSGRTWAAIITNGVATFKLLPPKTKYTVNVLNGDDVEQTFEVVFGFGEYKELDVGLDPKSWKGLKAIVNAGLETSLLSVGDEITSEILEEEQTFSVLHIDYRKSTYGNNIIVGKKSCLTTAMQMNATNTNKNGYGASEMANYLDKNYFESLPEDMQKAISTMSYQAGTGNSSSLQTEKHKIWLPLEYNVFGVTTHSASSEHSIGLAEQFSYFATSVNRVKTLGTSGSATKWWLGSPEVENGYNFCVVTTAGAADASRNASNTFGILPCFMIAAD